MGDGGGLSFGAATEGYEEDPQAKLLNETCIEAFTVIRGLKKGVNCAQSGHYFFEIGSGTGGTTSFVLPSFDPNSTRYVFSDLSQAFLTNARGRFAEKFPFVEYSIFNGDKHPSDQGFNSYEMDAILSTNCIHATIHLAATMATCHILLQPGGHIIFNEVNNPGTLYEDLTYGLTDGWWLLTDCERRVTYPLLRVPEWLNLFTQCGFKNVWHTPDEGPYFSQQAVLVSQCGERVQPTYLGIDPMPRADPNMSYLITGAVGGLGLISALILLERGARHFFFVSRRDKVPAEAVKWYELLEKSSAIIRRERCNVANPNAIERLFEETPEWPACAGVVHAAGVLSDGTIQKQTRKKYEEVFGPKVHGAYYLHHKSGSKLQKMQVNLMMSSMAGFMGSPGQNNHSAGNMGLEGLVDFDRKMGIVGSSIAWGAVAEVGYAARHELASNAMAVRFVHAQAVMEALLARPWGNVGISPSVWEFGKGAQAMKQLVFAGLQQRFKKAGFRRQAKPKAQTQPNAGDELMKRMMGGDGDDAADESEALVDVAGRSDAENLLQGAHVDISGSPYLIEGADGKPGELDLSGNVFESMQKMHDSWQSVLASKKLSDPGDRSSKLLRLGQEEVC